MPLTGKYTENKNIYFQCNLRECACVCEWKSPASLGLQQTPRVWTACGPEAPPLLTNPPPDVYHTGSGVEDSSLPVHMPPYQSALSRLVNMFF